MEKMEIAYKQVKHLLEDWETDILIDIGDLDYLDKYLKAHDIKIDVSLVGLGKLYNRFSEEAWAASWEDNAEGQFIEWLKENAGVGQW